MTCYRKKLIIIEAFKWTGDIEQIDDPEWICKAIKSGRVWFVNEGTAQVIMALDTICIEDPVKYATRGDWIIKDSDGEIYPCKPKIFEQTYEEMESTIK